MADKTPEQEPSIEEILASIRQIISDDEDKDGGEDPAAEQLVTPETQPIPEPAIDFDALNAIEDEPEPEEILEEDEDDVLDLTELAPEQPGFAEPTAEEEKAIDLALQEIQETLDKEEVTAMPPVNIPEEPLLNAATKQATLASMAKLVGNMPVNRQTSASSSDVTLEDIVRDILHPMLKDWVNENLPPIVERVVQKELEKLARQALDE